MQPGVILDTAPGGRFGAVKSDVNSSYRRGETVSVIFWSANPRNNMRIQDTFLTVEKLQSDGTWKVIANDGNWETRYMWTREGISESLATITWTVPLVCVFSLSLSFY